MTTKQWMLAGLSLLLVGFSVYLNRDWFGSEEIQVIHRISPRPLAAVGTQGTPAAAPVLFGFNRQLQLTELKVLLVSELETNKYPHPIWHLVSESNSVPIKSLTYGVPVDGMRPAVTDSEPDPLQPGADYRLRIKTADKKQLEHDFTAAAVR